MSSEYKVERIHTIVIGGGQAGLSVGYHLKRQNIPFLILDAGARIGDAWRNRWDSLRLFTPARYDGLPGMPFPAPGDVFPTKDEMADYLQSYARRFNLPVLSGVKVDGLSKQGNQFVVTAGSLRFEADNVVVAMANYQAPRQPGFARDLDPSIVQLHVHGYRNALQLQEGGVLIVGAGNSGADIALDVAEKRPVWMSGKEAGHIPYRIESWLGRFVAVRLLRFVGHRILTVSTPVGRKLRPKFLHRAAPLIRVKPADLVAAGIRRVPRVVGVRNGQPLLADDRTLDVTNVIWCTGFDPSFNWIKLPIFDHAGDPLHERGIVAGSPGLYFVGLQFLYSMTSATINGVDRDAKRVVKAIKLRSKTRQAECPGRLQVAEAA